MKALRIMATGPPGHRATWPSGGNGDGCMSPVVRPVAWLVITAGKKTAEDEANLLRHLARFLEEHHQVVDDDLAQLNTIDPDEVWRRLIAEEGDKSDLVLTAEEIAGIDGRPTLREQAVIADIARYCVQTD